MKLTAILAFALLTIFNQKNVTSGNFVDKVPNSMLAEGASSRLLWCLKQVKLFVSESPNGHGKFIKKSLQKL